MDIKRFFLKFLSCSDNVILCNGDNSTLYDGYIYVVGKTDKCIIDKLTAIVQEFISNINTTNLLYKYDLEYVENITDVVKDRELYNAVVKNNANVIIPLCSPNSTGRQFIVRHIDWSEFEACLPSMITDAENISKNAIKESLIDLSLNNADLCKKLLLEDFWIFDYKECSFEKLDSSSSYLNNHSNDKEEMLVNNYGVAYKSISFQESREIFSRFINNCIMLKQAEKKKSFMLKYDNELKKAKNEIDYVFNVIWGANKNLDSLRMIILNQGNKKLQASYSNLLDRENIAKKSKIIVHIEKSPNGIDRRNKNDGNYRVYVSNKKQKIQIHFKRKPSCIVYMMYLLDKVQRDESVNTLSIAKNRTLFCKLYSMVYNSLDYDNIFTGMISNKLRGDARQISLADCYQDIRNSLEEAIRELGEESTPFVIPQQNLHLTIIKSNIIIPRELSIERFSY